MDSKIKKLPERVYYQYISKDLIQKMVFIGGPRQVGKTTFATSYIKDFIDNHPGYLNWDNDQSKKIIQKQAWPKTEPLIIFDEIHKRKGWQNFIKGIWDTWKNTQRFIITGSARLDLYRRGGDSMMGRYHYYRLHPYTLPELGYEKHNLDILFRFGGFPEPLIDQNEINHRRWRHQRIAKLVKVDLRDLENVSDLDKVELLAESLESRVGSPLSSRSFSEDLEISDKTIKRWIQVLENLYFCFLIYPLGSTKIKAVKKHPKLYLWDWSGVENEGARFENLVASHLLKFCHFQEDVLGYKMELRFIRDQTGKECDFVVLKNKKPLFAVECKLKSESISPNLYYFRERLPIPVWYQVHYKDVPKQLILPNLISLSFADLCRELKLI